ncbi:MAG TPA: T9SS type A sorting domain-containing protein [Candidatus Didemnitutus sp.]|nr:T9SS type A sorting domain-containing protein [Candidatus Didemnitutus sp.]
MRLFLILLGFLLALAQAFSLPSDPKQVNNQAGILIAQLPYVDLGAVRVGQTRDTLIERAFTNESDRPVQIFEVKILGGQQQFTVTSPRNSVTLRPGESINVGIRVRPQDVLPAWASVKVFTDSDFDPSINLIAAGAYAEPDNGLSVIEPVFLGNIELGTGLEFPLYHALANVGFVDMTIDTMYITGDYSFYMYLENTPSFPFILRSGETLPLTLHYLPGENGFHGAQIVVRRGGRTTTIPILGVGGTWADPFVVSLTSLQGATRDTVLEFHHIYETPLIVKSIDDVVAPFEIVETIPSLPATLDAYQSLRVRARLRSSEKGKYVTAMRVRWESADGEFAFTKRMVLRAIVEAPTSVEDPTEMHRIVAYPVPADNQLVIRASEEGAIERVEVRTTSGALWLRSDPAGQSRAEINVQSLSSGVYQLMVYLQDGSVESAPFLVLH